MGNFDIKRTLVTLLVISAIWLVWINFFAKKQQLQPPGQQQQTQTQTQTPAQTPTQTPTPTPTKTPKAEAPKAPAEKVEIGTARWKARFTTAGGALESFQLLDQQYRRVVDGHEQPQDL